MNRVVTICLAASVTLIVVFLIYVVPYFSKKKVRQGKFDMFQFAKLFFTPILIIPVAYFLRNILLLNPEIQAFPLSDTISTLVFLFLMYFIFLGNGIHSLSVILSKHMKDLKHHKIWEINEWFHHGFSHFMVQGPIVLLLFNYALIELNRPNAIPLTKPESVILVVSGLISGILMGLIAIEGRIVLSIRTLLYICSLTLPLLLAMTRLDFVYFPFTTFTETLMITAVLTITLYGRRRKGFPEIVPHHFFEDESQ